MAARADSKPVRFASIHKASGRFILWAEQEQPYEIISIYGYPSREEAVVNMRAWLDGRCPEPPVDRQFI